MVVDTRDMYDTHLYRNVDSTHTPDRGTQHGLEEEADTDSDYSKPTHSFQLLRYPNHLTLNDLHITRNTGHLNLQRKDVVLTVNNPLFSLIRLEDGCLCRL